MSRMKCGIVNYWYCDDHGAILTAYALYQLLKDNKIDAELVLMNCMFANKNGISYRFVNKYAKINEDPIIKDRTFKKKLEKYNCILVGSDQVFRTEWVPDEWFLNFSSKQIKKIAVSASFGDERLNCKKAKFKAISYWIRTLDYISIRERNSVVFCKKITQRNDVKHVMDPVFLVDKQHFYDLISKSSKEIELQSVCCYFRDTEKEIDIEISKFCKKNNLIKYDVTNEMSVEDFLKTISSSNCVYTDSYHGMCFALIFGIPFLCLENKMRGISRYDSVKKDFNLSDYSFAYSKEEYIAKVSRFNFKCDDYYANMNQWLIDEGRNWIIDSIKNGKKKKWQFIDLIMFNKAIPYLFFDNFLTRIKAVIKR